MKRDLRTSLEEFFDTYRPNRPKLVPYLVRDGKEHPVAIICPGGGYRRVCSFIEGRPYARALNRLGYHAVVVYYHVKDNAHFPAPMDDLARAVKTVLDHAKPWRIDPAGYSVWGSSAGGHLAASFGTESLGWRKYGLPRPGAMVLVYPVVTMGEKAHAGSKRFLLGDDPTQDQIQLTSIDQQITAAYPPTFLWWGSADSCVDPDNSRMLARALEENHVPCIHREYPGVEHGVGIGTGLGCEGWFEDAVAFWARHRKQVY